jgi:hypothetical protein
VHLYDEEKYVNIADGLSSEVIFLPANKQEDVEKELIIA